MKRPHQIRCNNCNKINQLDFNPAERKLVRINRKTNKRLNVGYGQLLSTMCVHCGEKVAYVSDFAESTDAINRGYAKLVEAVIYSALRPYRNINSWQDKEMSLKVTKERNRKFSMYSKLIGFFAEAFGIDETYIRKAIWKANA